MRRNPEHVLQFTLAELGTEGSIDGNQRLVIRGRYVPKVSDVKLGNNHENLMQWMNSISKACFESTLRNM